MGDAPITREEAALLLCNLEHRGNHATGIAVDNEGQIAVCKKDVPAWSFVASEEFKDFCKKYLLPTTNTVILHTRAATVGEPWKNENNHPLYGGKIAVVHNGGIQNHNELFRELALDRSCETDSDIIRAILDKEGLTHAGVRRLSRMEGSGAIAAISPEMPGYLFLARSGNPIVLGSTEDKLYFASELQAIQRAVRPWIKRFGLFVRATNTPNLGYNGMPDDSAYLIGPKGLEWHQEIKITTRPFIGVNYRLHDSYNSKTSQWKRDKKNAEEKRERERAETTKVALCRSCKTGVAKEDEKESWANLICPKCKKSLSYLEAN